MKKEIGGKPTPNMHEENREQSKDAQLQETKERMYIMSLIIQNNQEGGRVVSETNTYRPKLKD